MTFRWPQVLYILVLLPGVVACYIWILHRRRNVRVRYSSAVLLREAMPRTWWLRRHLPFGLLVAALATLMIAASGPRILITVPAKRATVILAIDVSRSMCATDMSPTRLQAAEAAAATFIADQKPGTEIGIVAYADFAELIQPPTTDREATQQAIRSLLTGGREAIGSAIMTSLDAVAEADPAVMPTTRTGSPAPKGAVAADAIVLVADGVNSAGPPPMDAARAAADRGVRIYTIGFGTANGPGPASCQSSDPGEFGAAGAIGAQGGSPDLPRGIDEAMLKRIAAATGGAYYPAGSAGQLRSVLLHLPTHLSLRRESLSVSVVFAAAGALLAATAMALSLYWHPRA
jgi:Ca-activated chloride channel family protein